MSYGRGRSRLVVGFGAGLGAWAVGTVLFVAFFSFVLAPGTDESVLRLTTGYPIMVVWFLAALLGQATPAVVLAGVVTSLLLGGAGGAAAAAANLGGPRDAVGLGLAVATGHALGVAVVMASAEPIGIASRDPAARTFFLAFGGFVVPATLAVVGGVVETLVGR